MAGLFARNSRDRILCIRRPTPRTRQNKEHTCLSNATMLFNAPGLELTSVIPYREESTRGDRFCRGRLRLSNFLLSPHQRAMRHVLLAESCYSCLISRPTQSKLGLAKVPLPSLIRHLV